MNVCQTIYFYFNPKVTMSLLTRLSLISSAAFLISCGDKDSGDSSTCSGTVHTVTTTDDSSDMEVYMDFSPEDLTIAAGDCVEFVMSNTHNAVEISQESYESSPPSGTPLDGGFQVNFGETLEVQFDDPGVHYYVCQPHISMGMLGTITVE